MDKTEFKEKRKLLGYTVDSMAELLEVSRRTIINMENGKTKISTVVEKYINDLVQDNKTDLIYMDVSKIDKLSLSDCIKFCFKKKEAFLKSEEMKLLLENVKSKERNSIYEEHIILKNQKSPH
ncbi:helix-turn-helix domain-containing protein (plasmid) [Aquimarina sp. TRL1]|uniref:helix-turn-helix transcriptional regulator n=1 Tax=Aquimarina sp. (strain TRL1) TaxID=2736252 RepID=UPI00158C8B4A|nr:helix-turn-helix domain-containing protein [Aquimarina sp. TRL1]QKX07710.1 helix-turn-helix domain-containing protein [Aquimarina sp. TRL1]